MNTPYEQYLHLASEARKQAAASSLPQVKLCHLRSVEHFEELAAKLDSVAQAKGRNAAARAAADN